MRFTTLTLSYICRRGFRSPEMQPQPAYNSSTSSAQTRFNFDDQSLNREQLIRVKKYKGSKK